MARSKNPVDERKVRQFYIIQAVGSKSFIEPAREIRRRIDFLKDFLRSSNRKGYVLGISGGIDSALAGKLTQLAVDELRLEGYDATFVAMKLPYGIQLDATDVEIALDFIKPDQTITFNIEDSVDAFINTFASAGVVINDYHKGNIKARVRMTAQYAVAGDKELLVIGSDNAPEYTLGYFTIGGDGLADIIPLSGLTKRQEKALMVELDAPESIINKTPTADLLDNKPQQADEDELGINYEVLSSYLEGETVSEEDAIRIEERFMATEYKRQPPVSPNDAEWWRK